FPDDEKMQLRIGINVGDVMVKRARVCSSLAFISREYPSTSAASIAASLRSSGGASICTDNQQSVFGS
ncbi:hypothetical protein ACC728_40005, partial [Rhizobium ruizarguesonis]